MPDKVHDGGTYVCMEGPVFHALRVQPVPFLKGLRHWNDKYPRSKTCKRSRNIHAISMSTDYDCWMKVMMMSL